MRLDVFLKISRLVKRRTLSQEFCRMGLIEVNGVKGKPGRKVSKGDRIRLLIGSKILEVEILYTPQGNVPAKEAQSLYRILSEENTDIL